MTKSYTKTNFKSSLSYKLFRFCILSAIVVVTIIRVNDVRADIAPPEPPSGANPVPGGENTNVRMVAETVLIDIDGNSPYDEGIATITATFTMRNLGNTDEKMDVRFPLDQTTTWGNLCKDIFPQFPTITNLKVKVNGQSIATQKTYETITVPTADEPYPTITIPCWEHFPASFPVGKNVIIEVRYTTEPYHDWDASYVYSYILETGGGWRDTIGTADITVTVPYELSDANFYSCFPKDCIVNTTTVQWHFEEFEPATNIGISLFPPPLWQRIAFERKNITQNPNDGEAWGRLGKAYKEAIKALKGFRTDPASQEIYQLSKEAYRKAITLLPRDADWHYGFADLLCWKAGWNSNFGNPNDEEWRECVEQIKATLDINPLHEGTKELILFFPELNEMINFSGSQPDYLILTPQPTPTTSLANATIPAGNVEPTTTPLATMQVTTAGLATPIVVFTSTSTTTALSSKTSNMPFYIGTLAALLLIVLIFARLRKR